MKKEVIIVLLNQFADWEAAFLTPGINTGVGFEPTETGHIAKTLSIDGKEIRSIGGMRVVPDYSLATLPDDFSALVLVGGFEWFGDEANALLPLIEKAIREKKIVAAICNASIFLAINGFLNEVNHTSNMPELISKYDTNGNYRGHNNYLRQRAVNDRNIITANGSSSLEFAREILLALQIDEPEHIERLYDLHKLGFDEAAKKWHLSI